MKLKSLILCLIILAPIISYAQLTDSALIKKLSVNGFCLCKTSLTNLKQSLPNLRQVEVEEMDLPKKCLGQDSRYTAGSGYACDEQPGIVFQKDQETDYISKIRLTRQFKGNLPDGHYIDLGSLRLKDLFSIYPQLKDDWGSRGCSDYWKFSNDTISFYVKIDPEKQPQFPIDQAYYLEKPVEAVDLVMSCYSLNSDKQDIVFEDTDDPLFFIDSIRVNKNTLKVYDPSEIASVTVYKDSNAVKKMGLAAKNGLIYIETKEFAKQRYWNYFKMKSSQYAQIVPTIESNKEVQYILNKRVLKENSEGDLAAIDDSTFKDLRILTKKELIKEFGISDKQYGVVITSDVPGNLYNR
ncbi:hypothetical protein EKH83_09485 [Arcticibacter tournemirensis]|uniref:Uncharacterized protein n=2 Tax=Arcticibacter tournemirensis TaxID=699437 RepID=A0A4Q0MBB5_9SPHI|nr:hypothetical protein EKH83_09485 [Arcticibacter tournemirensis]